VLPPALLFFDGHCVLCHRSVSVLLRLDRAGRLRFAPLQGPTARAKLDPSVARSVGAVVLLVEGEPARTGSDAVVRVLALLGPPWSLAAFLLRLVPRALREAVYGVIARIRYRAFGRLDACPLPPPARAGRFLP
jgi:predicted DCC family thiol-disulfide oxidoreductase YuxK